MNNNEVRTGDTDDHDQKQVANEEVSSVEEILGSVWQTDWCRRWLWQ